MSERVKKRLNIFILDRDPRFAARFANDIHVSKMVTETGQILSTVVRKVIREESGRYPDLDHDTSGLGAYTFSELNSILYRATHMFHPCVVWTSWCGRNFDWLREYFFELAAEYTYRFGKEHATYTRLFEFLENFDSTIINGERLNPPLTVPKLVTSKTNYRQILDTNRRQIIILNDPEVNDIAFSDNDTSPAANLGATPLNVDQRVEVYDLSNLDWDTVVNGYRLYYVQEKLHIAKWTRREAPDWVTSYIENRRNASSVVSGLTLQTTTKKMKDTHGSQIEVPVTRLTQNMV